MKEEILKRGQRQIKLARTYAILDEGESERIKKLIRSSEYKSIERFAEKVLMIHRITLVRKLEGERKFHYYEIQLIEDILETKINYTDVLVRESI